MITKQTEKSEMFIFSSVADLTEWTDPDKFKPYKSSFVGRSVSSFSDLREKSRNVWAEGLYVLEKFVTQLETIELPEVKDTRRKTSFSFDDGDEVDYDKLMSGQPFFRRATRDDSSGPKDVTIYIDTTTPYRESSENILWRGAAAIALACILEAKGYRVELWVVNGSDLYAGKHTHVMTACCLKSASDPLDRSTLINTVSGWFYRSAIFTTLETMCAFRNERVALGLGACYEPNQNDLDMINVGDVRVYSSGVFSFSGAVSMIKAEVEKLNATSNE